MRHPFFVFSVALLCSGSALAQSAANVQPGVTPVPTTPAGPAGSNAQSGPEPGPAAPGGQPTSAQQSLVPNQSDQEPKLAPGATGDQGTTMPKSNDDSGTTTTYAAPKQTEEARWPCAQAKVSSISAGTIWSGPDPAEGKDWDEDTDLASLAQKLASRRTTLEEVDPLIADFAKKAGADKDKKLTKLFVGVLDIINDNRDKILQGIMRYAQGQQRLAERMRDESDKISQAQDAAIGNSGLAAQQKNQEFAWDRRIFKERKQALSYVCETPSILERRAYEIGKRIQAQL